jgi:hypothetical protein
MVYKLPDAASLVPEKASTLQRAAELLPTLFHTNKDATFRAKLALVKVLQDQVATELSKQIEARIQEVYAAYEIINGDRSDLEPRAQGVWDEQLGWAIEADLKDVQYLVGDDSWENLASSDVRYHEIGRFADVARDLAPIVARTYVDVAEKDYGKLLARFGIVKADIDALAKIAASTPVPAEPPPEPEPVVKTHAPEAPPAEQAVPGPVPNKRELMTAFKLYYDNAGPSAEQMAKKLDVSRGTFMNYATGRTSPKISPQQATLILEDIDRRMEGLRKARAVFERVR